MIRILLLSGLISIAYCVSAQWSITQEGTPFVIDFDNTVTGVNNGQFAGTGFNPSPAAGQLNSNAWAVNGGGADTLNFGGSAGPGNTFFSRGSSSGSVSTSGVYAFEVSAGNYAVGIQPSGSRFSNENNVHHITLRVQNNTGHTINEMELDYLFYHWNNEARSSFIEMGYYEVPSGQENNGLISSASFTFIDRRESPGPATGAAWNSEQVSQTVSGLNLIDGQYLFVRFAIGDVGGAGSRDQLAIDDITIQFNNAPTGITQLNTPLLINFDQGVVGVNNGQFTGSGFDPSPAAGQLNSYSWASRAQSSATVNFGGSETSGVFARGTSSGGVSTSGVYAFQVTAGNHALGFQPGGSNYQSTTNLDHITLRIQNNTGQIVNEIDLGYTFYEYNDQNSSSFIRLGYYEVPFGDENNGLIAPTSFTFIDERTSTGPLENPATWQSESVFETISGINLQPNQFLFIRWSIGDVIGGTRDELAIDDIHIEFRNVPTGFSDFASPLIIDFDQGVPGINNGQFTGSGFSPNPTSGQLNSNAFITGGWSDAPGSIGFGDTSPSSGDFARGTNAGNTGTGGFWAFTVGPGNHALGIKPSGSDFTPGFVTLRIQNQTNQPVGAFELSYNILVFNNGDRGNSFNFSYSNDNVNFIAVDSLDFVSPEAADVSPAWVSTPRSAFLDDFLILPGQYIYFRWDGDDETGGGLRDAFALDDIVILPVSQLDLIVPTLGEWALMILGMIMLLMVTLVVKIPGLPAASPGAMIAMLPIRGAARYLIAGIMCYAGGLLVAVLFYGGFGIADLIGGLILCQLAGYWLYTAMLPEVKACTVSNA